MGLKAALCRGKVLSTLQTKLLSPQRDAVETAINRGAERRTHILGQPTPGRVMHDCMIGTDIFNRISEDSMYMVYNAML